MRKLVSLMHVSLDGFIGTNDGSLSWVRTDPPVFEISDEQTRKADVALYGRKTFEMMEAYWPTAADKPEATSHDKNHSRWYASTPKYVLSHSLAGDEKRRIHVLNQDIEARIRDIKNEGEKNILLLGSPKSMQYLLGRHLIDELLLFINPVFLGEGIPLFRHAPPAQLQLLETREPGGGVIALRYAIQYKAAAPLT